MDSAEYREGKARNSAGGFTASIGVFAGTFCIMGLRVPQVGCVELGERVARRKRSARSAKGLGCGDPKPGELPRGRTKALAGGPSGYLLQ